ncbi:MAG TPA: TerD family protein, partial [Segatella copri]|nr:TerD family protein [Segatella copri]
KENFSTETAVEAAKLVCNDEGEWEFEAVGEGHDGGMQTLIDIYA